MRRQLGGRDIASTPSPLDSTSLPSPQPSRSMYGFVVAFALTLLLIAELIPSGRTPGAVRGFLDLSGPRARDQVARLRGEWEFYWGKLLSPKDFEGASSAVPTAYMRLPGIWTRARPAGRPLPSIGDATFRLKVRHPWKGAEVGLKLTRINCAFELYADSRLIAKAGSLSEARGGFVGGYEPQSVYFSPLSDETDLVLRVSNRVPGAWSGPLEDLVIGPRKAIEAETNGSVIADAFNASGRLLFFALFLALFLISKDRLALVFSVTSLVMALRISIMREMIFLRIFPGIAFGAFVRITLSATTLSLPLLLMTFESFLRANEREAPGTRIHGPRPVAELRIRDWVLMGAGAFGLVAILYFIVAGDSVYLRYFEIFVPAACLCFAYYSALIFYYALRRRISLGAAGIYLLMFYYTVYDILSQARVIDQQSMYPLFFLRRIPSFAGLATVQLQQGIIGYLYIAFIGFYFVYDILRRMSSRQRRAVAGPAAGFSSQFVSATQAEGALRSGRETLDELAREHGLSEREKEILSMAARGLSYERIGELCFISKNTVKTHLGSIYRKLGVKNKTELANRLVNKQ
jgi:DNA-binding CsgD family transcriptional regulator